MRRFNYKLSEKNAPAISLYQHSVASVFSVYLTSIVTKTDRFWQAE
jgi:hypothetical protein